MSVGEKSTGVFFVGAILNYPVITCNVPLNGWKMSKLSINGCALDAFREVS